MPCFRPLHGYLGPLGWQMSKPYDDAPELDVPCGKCIGCRLDYARDWAIRCQHESEMHEDNAFLTLTYSPDQLPANGSLELSDYQNFMKRLRERTGKKLKFFHCGEYGEKNSRPHYHALIFGFSFPDRTPWRKTPLGHTCYRSKLLEQLWQHGQSEIGEVTFQSAGYVARYVTKKIGGEPAETHYRRADPETGELGPKIAREYVTMSRRPGIGATWYEKFKNDVFPRDYIIVDGKKYPVPRYYDKLLEEQDHKLFLSVKRARAKRSAENYENSTQERLRVREECKEAQARRLARPMEAI